MLDVCSEVSVAQHPLELAPVIDAPAAPVLVRSTRDPRRLEVWQLVLVSRGLSSHARAGEGAYELWVAAHDATLACAELDLSDAEEREAQRIVLARTPPARPATPHAAAGGALLAVLLLAFFAVTGSRVGGSAWFTAGASDAERVLQGEWWRAVTALTLHADAAHVVSNVGIGALVVGAVMRSEGLGVGAALVLAAGTGGNLLNAWAHQSLHSSVGFSTAVFGAIGLLGGLAHGRKTQLRWTALGGSLALLGLLGASERSDIFAHLFGACMGVGLGLLVAWSGARPKAMGQVLAGLASATLVIGAWLVALA